jgi:pilus assembly protein TadC
MEYAIALLVAVLAALLASHVQIVAVGLMSRRLRAAYEQNDGPQSLPFYRGLLSLLGPVVKYTPPAWLKAVGQQLYWAQLAGRWAGWTLPEITALHIASAVIGALIGLLLAPSDVALLLALAAAPPFLLNLLALRSPARKVHRQIQAELPELAALMAAEVGAGTTISEALNRLSRGSGMGAMWLRRAVTGAVGGLLLSTDTQEGALMREAQLSGDEDLIALAINLDKLAQRGTGARALLSQAARSAAAQYIAAAHIRAEKVGSEIILPMVFFFFLPYVAVLLMVLGAPLLSGVLVP